VNIPLVERVAFEASQWAKDPANNPGHDQPSLVFARRFAFLLQHADQAAPSPWLPIVLCPTDGVDRMLLLPDGKEVAGAYHNGGLGQPQGWETKTPFDYERPVYEYPLKGGFLGMPWEQRHSRPEPEPKQIGVRKEIMWLIGKLPEGVYPTHFRPNDTVHGPALAEKSTGSGDGR
jgi:hypothetical protein